MSGVINIKLKQSDVVFLIFTVLVVIILFVLGFWQVTRMKWKNELITKIENIAHTNPIMIDSLANETIKSLVFHKVIISGSFEPNFNLYRYNNQHNKASYDVFNIFNLLDGHKFLVKRNFAVPYINFKYQKANTTIIAIVLLQPQKSMFTLSNNFIKDLIFNIDIASINQHYKINLEEGFYLQQLKNDQDNDISKDILANIHNNHKLYAFTWFSLGIIIIIMALVKFRID